MDVDVAVTTSEVVSNGVVETLLVVVVCATVAVLDSSSVVWIGIIVDDAVEVWLLGAMVTVDPIYGEWRTLHIAHCAILPISSLVPAMDVDVVGGVLVLPVEVIDAVVEDGPAVLSPIVVEVDSDVDPVSKHARHSWGRRAFK